MNKLLCILFFAITGTIAQAQNQTDASTSTVGSADGRKAEASSESGSSVVKSTGKLTVIDATKGGLRVFTGDGNGTGSWVSGTTPTLVNGTLPDKWPTLTRRNLRPGFVYSGASITLPPGKWLVYVNATYLNSFNRGMNVWWDLSTSNTANTQLGRAVSSAAPPGSLMPVTASYVVQMVTTTTYYLWAAVGTSITSGVSGTAPYSGEGRIYALPIT